jgi:hypothetical protein
MEPCTPDSIQIDVKQTEMASEREKNWKSKLKAIRENKVVIKIIVNSAICAERSKWCEEGLTRNNSKAENCVLQ